MESDHNPQKKIRWFSWRRTRKMKSRTKTVPLDTSLSGNKRRADHIRSSKSKSKAKSKPNPQKPSLIKSQTPATNPPLPTQASPVVPVVPNQAPSQTRHRHRARQDHANSPENGNRSHRKASSAEDTRRESGSSRAMSRAVSLPFLKRQDGSLSSLSLQPQTTLNKENARRYDPVVGMSAVLVTLVIMILWGRLCAVLCTSAWFYFMRRFRMATENDKKNMNTYSTNPDFDSKVYKKKVILEGLLERNHRGTL